MEEEEAKNSPNLIHHDMDRIMIIVVCSSFLTTVLFLKESTLNAMR